MSDINSITLTGRLVRDPETKQSGGGLSILSFSIANGKKIKGEEFTNFIDCVIFGKFAEVMGQYLTKGKQVALTGELKQDRWEKDGQKRSRMSVIVKDLQMIGGVQKAEASKQITPENFDSDIAF